MTNLVMLIVFHCCILTSFEGNEKSMLAGNLCAILSGGLITVIVSLVQMRDREINVAEVWETTRDIDNPLNPWTEVYARYVLLSM